MSENATPSLLIGASAERRVAISPKMANRHGLIAGATGTGKTITLQVLAQSFSDLGVPVLVPDIKGDFSGIAKAGTLSDKLARRAAQVGLPDMQMRGAPTAFWDVFGEHGHPLRLTMADFGPIMLARLLNLNETQSGVLQILFRVADDNGWLLLDLKDLRSMLSHLNQHRADIGPRYGNISPASIGAIQRSLLNLEGQDGERLFGEPVTLEESCGARPSRHCRTRPPAPGPSNRPVGNASLPGRPASPASRAWLAHWAAVPCAAWEVSSAGQ